jgi:glycosyltransferase involved in cell wall biosynthesis
MPSKIFHKKGMTSCILSIIIPCYNCASTLEASVESCFTQGLNFPFEIILVNDASTDNTQEIIDILSIKHSQIKSLSNRHNLGGGATRNIGIQNSNGDMIFCLDGDDILPENTLIRMYNFLTDRQLTEKCDGVVFGGSISFKDSPTKGTKINFNLEPDKPISLGQAFSGNSWGVGANFMYTREAFNKAGGYPEYHNFDTQGYGVRFLKSGLKAFLCPDTYFYQRQFSKKYSYFERSYNNGEYSIGNYFILREISDIFTKKARDLILKFDSFAHNKLGINEKSIMNLAIELHRSGKLFAGDNDFITDDLSAAEGYFLENKFLDASQTIIKYIKNGGTLTQNLRFELLLNIESINGKKRISQIIDQIRSMNINNIKSGYNRLSLFQKIKYKILCYLT